MNFYDCQKIFCESEALINTLVSLVEGSWEITTLLFSSWITGNTPCSKREEDPLTTLDSLTTEKLLFKPVRN